MVASAPVAAVAAVAPTERSVRGAAAQGGTPPARVFERPVIARTAPPPASAGFAAQQQQLQAQPGKPVEESERKGMRKPASAEPAPVVNVVAQPKAAPPTALPPPADRGQGSRRSRQGGRAKGRHAGSGPRRARRARQIGAPRMALRRPRCPAVASRAAAASRAARDVSATARPARQGRTARRARPGAASGPRNRDARADACAATAIASRREAAGGGARRATRQVGSGGQRGAARRA